ncbi:hypothetical protein [Jiella sonneratiae]|uniref:Uncharacterized protein n=1 Tax=Jiella sonneratiae TaxID=2816856 RepID=A0ABS3JA48_9HYPH|nr:hypothetical protein [Jiella sonneratiae]MBO0905798.1 hypothetical protein [Jiella sonneratiae]
MGIIGRGVLPFLPLVLGVGLKFALIDQPAGDLLDHIQEVYLRPAWIEFIVTAFILGATALLSQPVVDKKDITVYAIVPLACFIVCVILVAGSEKAKIDSRLVQVYIPGIITAVSLAFSGGWVGKSSK